MRKAGVAPAFVYARGTAQASYALLRVFDVIQK
jgi:hypothetical protein